MKKIYMLFFTLALLLTSTVSKAQVIVVTSNGAKALYTRMDSAVVNADAGTNVYLSGGTFNISITLTKTLNFVGAGYFPDSTTATGKTFISAQFNLSTGSSNSSFTGIDFSSNFQCVNSVIVTNIIFSRCLFSNSGANTFFGGNIAGNTYTFSECIFTARLDGANTGNGNVVASAIFDRCLFFGALTHWTASTSFTHCTFVFNNPTTNTNNNVQSSLFQNCVFFNCNFPGWQSSVNQNTFANCITTDSVLPPGSTNEGNIFSVPTGSFFVNGSFPFSFNSNYQLLSSSPGHNFASDGTDCGVFGTLQPFKAGGVPYNPHFITNNIAPATNTSGQLNLKLNVAAQGR